MKSDDFERLRLVAEMIDTRERSELARLNGRASSIRSELKQLKLRLDRLEDTANPLAAEAFRKWCHQKLELETAALQEIERAMKDQAKAAATSVARTRVLEELAVNNHLNRLKAKRNRDLENQFTS